MSSILITDDIEAMRNFMAMVLSDAGHEAVAAESGQHGLAVVSENMPDLVITDIFMPDMDGIEVVRLLRTKAREMPILAVSAGSGHMSKELALRTAQGLGAADFLAKPFEPEDLVEKVGSLLTL